MPYQSSAQRGFFHHMAETSPEWARRAAEWDRHSKKKKKRKVQKSLVPKNISPRSGKFIPATELTKKEREKMAVRFSRQKRMRQALQKNLTPIYKSADPDFNHEAAQKTYELVMKMDEDSAIMFAQIVAADITEETIENNLRTVQKAVDQIVAKRLTEIKKATVRAAVNDSEAAVPFAKALSEISKRPLTPYDYGYVWREEDFRRDPSTGRFRTKVVTTQKKPISDKTAAKLGLPTSQMKRAEGLNSRELASFQDQYRQVASFLSTYSQSVASPGQNDVMLRLRNKGTNETYTTFVNGTRPSKKDWDPKTEDVIGIEARPATLTAGGAYFGLASSLGAQPGRRQADVAGTLNDIDAQMSGFANDWAQMAGDPRNSNARTYQRIERGSQLASAFAPPGSKIQAAARLGEFVGSHGAEAEAVFGPTARKTAYRYRGTEKTPDRALVEAYATEVQRAKMTSQVGTRDLAPVQMAAQRIQAERRAPTFEEINAGPRGKVQEYLETRIPKAGLYNLQLHSGNTPPSEGVIINSDGQIVTQAVGYGDDHYLPFNLKNLKSLKNGQYIRTRSVGGPTSEDIYTGLIAGARQVTVVSRSGTFTVEFEEDFRGGRRHNDKARRMTRRYEQLLDAVQSEQVDRKSIDPEIKAALRQEVMAQYGGYGIKPEELRAAIRQREEDFKSSPELSAEDEQLVRLIATQRAQGRQGRDAEDYMAQAMNDVAKEKEYKFRLNGVGYAAALDALQEQFPYYIKVSHAARRDDENRASFDLDRGYVEPGRNRPTAARAGLYGTKVNPGQKFSASQADYQRGRTGALKSVSVTAEAKTEEKPAEGKKDGEKSPIARVQEARQSLDYAKAAGDLQAHLKNMTLERLSEDDRKALALTAEQLRTPEGQKAFDTFVGRVRTAGANLGEAGAAYDRAANYVGRQEYSPERAGLWGTKPMMFPQDKNKQKVANEINAKMPSGVLSEKKLTEMDDRELEAEHSALIQMKGILAGGTDLPLEDRVVLLRNIGIQQGTPAVQRLGGDPKKIDTAIEQVHRARAWKLLPDEGAQVQNSQVLHRPAPTRDQAEEARSTLRKTAEQFTDVAARLAELGDLDLADDLYSAAAAINDELPGVNTKADADRIFQAHRDMASRAMAEMHRLNQQAVKRRGENGPILS